MNRIICGAGSTRRSIDLEGWNKANPPMPIDVSAVTPKLVVNGTLIGDADGAIVRDIAGEPAHTFTFTDDEQFQSIVPGDDVKIVLPDSSAGDGRIGWIGRAIALGYDPGAVGEIDVDEEAIAAEVAAALDLTAIAAGVGALLERLTGTRAGYLDNLSAGAVPTAAQNAAAAFSRTFHASKMKGWTFEQIIGHMASVLLGKSSDGGTTFRNPGDTATAVSGTVDDNGNRTAVAHTDSAVA